MSFIENTTVLERTAETLTTPFERRRPKLTTTEMTEFLPFEILFMRTDERLAEITKSRRQAYAEHHEENLQSIFGDSELDPKDTQANSLILYAVEKATQNVIGSIRISTNSSRPFQLEQELQLPEPYAGKHLASFGRLAVPRGRYSAIVKFALLKGAYLYSTAVQANHWLLATIAPIDRLYTRIGFNNIFPDNLGIHLHEAAFKLDVLGCESRRFVGHIQTNAPALYAFIFSKFHPDIKIFKAIAGSWAVARN